MRFSSLLFTPTKLTGRALMRKCDWEVTASDTPTGSAVANGVLDSARIGGFPKEPFLSIKTPKDTPRAKEAHLRTEPIVLRVSGGTSSLRVQVPGGVDLSTPKPLLGLPVV